MTIGDMVTITCETPGATIHYTATNTSVSESDPVYTEPFALTEDMITSSGKITILATAFKDGEECWPAAKAIYSDITIPGAEPEEVEQPVITPKSGSAVTIGDKVTITCETTGATIRYTTDGSGVSEASDIYTGPFALTESMISKATGKITISAMAYKDGKESEFPAKAIYSDITIPEPVEPPAAPTFANVGEVMQGDALEIEWPDDLDLSKYLDQAIILYVENDETTELEYDGTLGELQALAMGGGSISPWAKAGEPAFKLAVYDGDLEEWNPAVALSEVGTVNVRARMAVGSDYDEAPLYSDEFSATYTVTARPAPNAPVFLVNGEALEGTSVALEENEKAEVSWSGYPDESPEYIVVYTTDGSESVFEAESMMDEILEGNMWYFGDEAIEVSAPATIKAAVAEVSATYGITWSEIVTVAFTVKANTPDDPDDPEKPALPETVTAPTFVPAAGEVEKGQAIDWTWDETYNEYEIKGVVYVANGKDEDLNIDGAKYYELLAAWEDEDENTVREDGVVYLYLGEAEGDVYPYKVEKDVTVKARLVVGAMKEMAEGEEGEEPELELVLSPVVTAAYTVKGETPVVETVAAPTFSVAAGEVEKGTKVTIACTTEGATIYYTIDGTEPTAESIEYKAAIEINTDVTLKAIAVKGDAKSEVATAAYTVKVANENLELAGVS
ncbi:MAG: chitobiase/beta-hexosaminidase C-terminal domain-containing protein, partial [Bacteroidales bacterium]|nr:chitobiase/beta-hexosaminidase C-terminal domain-containing protein [Bacteroidales bacterium]